MIAALPICALNTSASQPKIFISFRRNNAPLGQLALPYTEPSQKLLKFIGRAAIEEIVRQYQEFQTQNGSGPDFQWYVRTNNEVKRQQAKI